MHLAKPILPTVEQKPQKQRVFKPSVKFIDLFAGIGGFRYACEKYGASCVFTSEYDKHAAKTYALNFGEPPAGDITKIPVDEIPAHELLCAGFPCQPFSVSGKQKGFEDARGTLFFDIARIAEHHTPAVLFLENVANLRNHQQGQTLKRMKNILNTLGYTVYYDVLNASDYGVPQARKRLYFVAFHEKLGEKNEFVFPEPLKTPVTLADVLEHDIETTRYLIKHPNMRIDKTKLSDTGNYPIRVGTIHQGAQGDRIYSPLGHAITLSAQGGGNGAKTGAYFVDGKVRKLTPTECRAVQGFPPQHQHPEGMSDSQLWKQYGNSVAVPVLEAILSCITLTPILRKYTKPA